MCYSIFHFRGLIFFLVFILVTAASCSTDSNSSEPLNIEGSFSEPSLSQQEIFELKPNGESLYAGTDSNLYRKNNSASDWQPLGLAGDEVRTFVVLSNQQLLAALNIDNRDSLTIARTSDGGQNWVPFRNGFGGGINRRIPSAMVEQPSETNYLFAGGPGADDIARSEDQGKSWNLISGTWENLGFLTFIKIYKDNPEIIWAGGSNAVSEPRLTKSMDNGKTWQQLTIIENVETTVYDLAVDPSRSNVLLAGLGGGIRKSTDGGQSWRTVLEGVNIYSMTKSAKDERIIYASGEVQSGQPAFFASGDFGDTWQQVAMSNGPGGIFVNDMVSVMENGKEVLYLGTNKGVYSYRFEE